MDPLGRKSDTVKTRKTSKTSKTTVFVQKLYEKVPPPSSRCSSIMVVNFSLRSLYEARRRRQTVRPFLQAGWPARKLAVMFGRGEDDRWDITTRGTASRGMCIMQGCHCQSLGQQSIIGG
jgi:hypothetical protein